MGAQIRVYRQKISSTTSMRKIFKAMELIATSRIGKARARVAASLPYANAITRAVSAVASQSEIDHPLVTEPAQIRRAAVLVRVSAQTAREVRALTQTDRGCQDAGRQRAATSRKAMPAAHVASRA